MKKRWFSALLIVMLLSVALVPVATAAPLTDEEVPAVGYHNDDVPSPLTDAQRELRRTALEQQMSGKVTGSAKVHEVAKGQYVELAREGEDSILTILGEFGTRVSAYGGDPGPLHNQIPEPDRSVDNTTIWNPDFNRDYFMNLLFSEEPGANSMRNFYIEQSSNRYAVNGDVSDWMMVPYNEAYYGSNYCGDIVCARTWLFISDVTNAWYNSMLASGMSAADIDAYLARFDVWDRYDYDGDGDFNEPDGYIDHFQAVHAGEGEETGGGAQGEDSIWSHRWYAFYNYIGYIGPDTGALFGGLRIGQSKYWIGDYTIEPENGGVGVFAHEFGHDLGLPDLYDTSGNVGGAENSTGFWTLYSAGSYGSTGIPADGIGDHPIHMSALEKIMLGWSNYQIVRAGEKASVKLGPAEFNTKQAQQLVVILPDKVVNSQVGEPYAGEYFYYSGSGNLLNNSMIRQVTLPAGASLTAMVNFAIEEDWDYAYLTVNGQPVPTSLSRASNPNGNNQGFGITGYSDGWVQLDADLSAFGGQTVTLGFFYITDQYTAEPGLMIDEIAISGSALDGAEADAGWMYQGFVRSDGTVSLSFSNYYVAEFRQYRGDDQYLRTGPYNFVGDTWVEHYPYQDGMLVWYWDNSFSDNNVGANCAAGRCGGLFLPVDAHPELLMRPDGMVWRPRVQSYDATFGLEPTDVISLTWRGVTQTYGGLPPNPIFDDTQSYWVAPQPEIGNYGWASVPLTPYGVTIRVKSVSAHNTFMQVQVSSK